MSKLIKEEPETGRLHIDSSLMGESVVSKELLKQTEATEYFRMHPDINVIKIGGQSIMDRRGKALFPILALLQRAKCLKELQIIDALSHPEHILAALEGEHVGTIIYK